MDRIVSADPPAIDLAARHLIAGRLVAFPTETVYGLGANALDPNAVARIFAAKGRPATNPVIVHLADAAALGQIAQVTETARTLAGAFWPGPLTLVLPKTAAVPDIVTAGGATVAVRVPRHPVALALLRASGLPIAAPSANRSESLSPTRAEHVASSLGPEVAMILDGGPCEVGLESTVLDLTVDPPVILRPGMISASQIAAVLGRPVTMARNANAGAIERNADSANAGQEAAAAPSLVGRSMHAAAAKSPGQMLRHYAPASPLRLTADIWSNIPVSGRIAVLAYTLPPAPPPPHVHVCHLPKESNNYASNLYTTLHLLDAERPDLILVEQVPDSDDWLPVRDRLRRAAAG